MPQRLMHGYASTEASLFLGPAGKETAAGTGMSSSPGNIGRGVQAEPGERQGSLTRNGIPPAGRSSNSNVLQG